MAAHRQPRSSRSSAARSNGGSVEKVSRIACAKDSPGLPAFQREAHRASAPVSNLPRPVMHTPVVCRIRLGRASPAAAVPPPGMNPELTLTSPRRDNPERRRRRKPARAPISHRIYMRRQLMPNDAAVINARLFRIAAGLLGIRPTLSRTATDLLSVLMPLLHAKPRAKSVLRLPRKFSGETFGRSAAISAA